MRASRESDGRATPPGGRFDGSAHVFPFRVYYADTDAAGIVYYANYLKFAERARTEMMRAASVSHSALSAERGIAFIVRRCAIDYRVPATLDDVIEVRTTINKLGGASIDVAQHVLRDGETLVTIDLRLGCVDRKGRAVRLPEPLRHALARMEPAGLE
jgi:acyl-CoA thioester hydrolase